MNNLSRSTYSPAVSAMNFTPVKLMMFFWVWANISEIAQFQSKDSTMELRGVEMMKMSNCLTNGTENNYTLVLMILEILQ